jgi:hypothetical protein
MIFLKAKLLTVSISVKIKNNFLNRSEDFDGLFLLDGVKSTSPGSEPHRTKHESMVIYRITQ